MARLTRADTFSHDEIAVVHVMARVVRRHYLLGTDPVSGKCYDHRRRWIESELERLAAGFGIDLLCYALLSNHLHLILRSRPDVVETWDDTEAARRWLLVCPIRKGATKPTEQELNSIRGDAVKLKSVRKRLSDISWWMKFLCQRIAQRANRESGEDGSFWSGRFRAVRLLDEESILACAAYVDLNPIRAALAETLEESRFTSVQARIQTLEQQREPSGATQPGSKAPDRFLAPVEIDERADPLGPRPSLKHNRASDKGFLPMSTAEYLELLDWTARQIAPGKPGHTPATAPPIFERLSLSPVTWCSIVSRFGHLFHSVAGRPQSVEQARSRVHKRRFRLTKEARELLEAGT